MTFREESSIHGHGGLGLTGEVADEQAFRGLARNDESAMVTALDEVVVVVGNEMPHLYVCRMAAVAAFLNDGHEVAGKGRRLLRRRGGRQSESEKYGAQ